MFSNGSKKLRSHGQEEDLVVFRLVFFIQAILQFAQGDTQILSLTPGAQANSEEGWTLIMPDWQNGEGASNHWRLSVVVEDNQGQRVSSNEITLTLVEPFDALSNDELRWEP